MLKHVLKLVPNHVLKMIQLFHIELLIWNLMISKLVNLCMNETKCVLPYKECSFVTQNIQLLKLAKPYYTEWVVRTHNLPMQTSLTTLNTYSKFVNVLEVQIRVYIILLGLLYIK